MVSDDRHAALIPVTMAGSLDDAGTNIDQVLDRTLHAFHPAGFNVWVAGAPPLRETCPHQGSSSPGAVQDGGARAHGQDARTPSSMRQAGA